MHLKLKGKKNKMSWYVSISPRISSATTLDLGYRVFECDCSSGSFTITLPNSVGQEGQVFAIKRIDTNPLTTLTLAAANSETINGTASITIPNNSTRTFYCANNDTNWRTF